MDSLRCLKKIVLTARLGTAAFRFRSTDDAAHQAYITILARKRARLRNYPRRRDPRARYRTGRRSRRRELPAVPSPVPTPEKLPSRFHTRLITGEQAAI